MSKALVQVIDGITYPREVPMPPGMPEGWKAIEQAYGPNSKSAGKTYVRYSSKDGRHRQIMGPKQVVQTHCNDLGIPWEPEFAKYEQAMADRKAAETAARAIESEARGAAKGAKREEMIALSRERFGELTGPLVLAFPGWKCRWDWLPAAQQTPKTFSSPDGREWKLLKDIECMFGTKLQRGGKEAEEVEDMVNAGTANTAAQAMFSEGSRRCRESEAMVEIDPATEEIQVQSREEFEQKREQQLKKRKLSKSNVNLLYNLSSEVYPAQEGWAAFSGPHDLQAGFTTFRALLKKRGFAEDVELLAVHGVPATCRFAARVSGVYWRLPALIGDRPCYQKLLSAPNCSDGVCCDGIYIMWESMFSQWQISTGAVGSSPCIAYSKADKMSVAEVSGPWQIQQQGTADFQEGALEILMAKSGV